MCVCVYVGRGVCLRVRHGQLSMENQELEGVWVCVCVYVYVYVRVFRVHTGSSPARGDA